MATEIAKAYIQIIPTTKGIQGALEDELTGAGEAAGKSSGKGFLSGMGGVISKGAKALGAAATAAAGGLAVLTSKAVSNFADYEQLVGGVETLFGESADIVQSYADVAFRTAGISANQYMETVTSFSASLLQSLGGDTETAAMMGNQAIIDMADNANKMGTDLASIQVAYQGFAKQNYTMLDNLKLGYGGTKAEMERLLADATAFSGIQYDINSLADVYEAIHVVQTEMGITGTTALEAATTISGSTESMRAAWANLVTGLANNNADMGALIDEFVVSLIGSDGEGGVINNVMSTVEHALNGIGGLIVGLTPIIATALPQLITQIMPDLLNSASALVMGIIGGIIDNLPFLMATGLDVVLALCQGLIQNVGAIIDGITAVMLGIVNFVINNLPQMIELGLRLVEELALGLIRAVPQLVAAIPQLIASMIKAFVDAIPQIWEVGKQIVAGVWEGIKKAKDAFVANIKDFFGGIVKSVKGFLGIASPSKVFAGIGGFMAEGLSVGFGDEIDSVRRDITRDVDSITGTITNASIGLDASVSAAGISNANNTDNSAALDRILAAIQDKATDVRVYLDSREIKAGQNRLARAVG